MKRREFITLLGGVAVSWPFAVSAQQPALPVIGFMSGRSADAGSVVAAAFRQGLNEAGFVPDRNVAIEFRADNFCIWPRALPRSRPSRASLGDKPTRRARCALSSALPPVPRMTSSRA